MDVEALLKKKEQIKSQVKQAFVIFYRKKCDQMMDYIKTLRLCIKWFQELEGNYLLEQENHKDLLETAEKKCIDMGND
ncbi:hypothetical protein RHGRI_017479 [Rhododendron griersonianum]|uniref:Uncharacterized protein n=1 Tax=Rhododendron griersonianum TaxID=479676 RepID=A0AAV6JXZ5_9ERIC|nr:hypothetical protein RHGRI_017479 [Rhododendron griersonianum]